MSVQKSADKISGKVIKELDRRQQANQELQSLLEGVRTLVVRVSGSKDQDWEIKDGEIVSSMSRSHLYTASEMLNRANIPYSAETMDGGEPRRFSIGEEQFRQEGFFQKLAEAAIEREIRDQARIAHGEASKKAIRDRATKEVGDILVGRRGV